ncbi:MAG TPA: hypothetical protein VL551_34995 [Actinospica sp.]|nr:hypothetical protein [Actinospica sp.]
MTSSKITRIVTATASVVVAGSLLAACGGGGSNSDSKNGGSGSSSAVVTQAGSGARLAGTRTADQFYAWVPSGLYPSDVNEVPDGLYTTGSKIAVNAKYSAASASCETLLDYTSGPGFGESAYIIDQGEDSAKKNSYSYGVYEFSTAAQATEFVKELSARFTACASFTYTNNGTSAPVTMADGPVSEASEVASGNTVAVLRASMTFNGKSIAGDYVFAADGNVVVFANSFSTTGAVSTAVDNAKVVQEILTAFTSGEASAGSSAGASGAASAAVDRIRVYSTDAVRAGVAR